jgi:hypothetical protein
MVSLEKHESDTHKKSESPSLIDVKSMDHDSSGHTSTSSGDDDIDFKADTLNTSSCPDISISNNEHDDKVEKSLQHSDLMLKIIENETPGCTCKKSKCLKLYCQCFAASALCDKEKCKCGTCKNDITRETEIMRARSNVLYRNPRAFEDKFTNAPTSRKLPCIRRNFSAMRNSAGKSLMSFKQQ